jgi:hypothetical protein
VLLLFSYGCVALLYVLNNVHHIALGCFFATTLHKQVQL